MNKSIKHFIVSILAILTVFLIVSCGGGTVDNTPAVVAATKAFQIYGTNESYDTLAAAIESLKTKSVSKDVAPWTIKLTKNVTDAGATISGISKGVVIDFQSYTYTVPSGSFGIIVDNGTSEVEITGGTIMVPEGSTLSKTAVITSNSDLKLSGTTLSVNSSVNAIESTAGTVSIGAKTTITTKDEKNAIVASNESEVKVTASEVTITGGLKLSQNAEIDLGEAIFIPTKPIEIDPESTLIAVSENIHPKEGSGVENSEIDTVLHHHTFSEEWESDRNNHWHLAKCGHDVISEKAEHIYVNHVCSVCGYIENSCLFSIYAGYISLKEKEDVPSEITIPSVFNGEKVIGIQNYAFSNCTKVQSIIVPDSVTSIGGGAFSGCTSLTSVTIPNSVTGIGEHSFSGCTGLTSVEIPNSVTSISNGAFRNCSGLTNIELPDSVTSIGEEAFYGCTDLTSIEIPNTVTSIGDRALYGCNGLTSITIPDSVTCIGIEAFAGCTGLTSIVFPDSVTFIGSSAFSGCSGLTSIVIPDSVAVIYSGAFSDCAGLTSLDIPSSVTYIGSSAFSDCTSLTNLEIPNSVEGIGEKAFYGCTSLTAIVIPDSVTSIGDNAFYYCNPLEFNNNSVCLFGYSFPSGLYKALGSPHNLVISEIYTSIGQDAFKDCVELTSITIPNSVTSIGWFAFSGCTGLTSITVPNSVTRIEGYAFYNCTGLTNIVIPFIGSGSGINENENQLGTIFGPQGSGSNSYIPSSLKEVKVTSATTIPYGAFSGCSGLTSIEIPDSVTSIGDDAFRGCAGLANIEIPKSVTSIGEFAFYGCTGLTSIEIPDSVTSIGSYAFYGCTGLEGVNINDLDCWLNINFVSEYSNPLIYAQNLYLNEVLLTEIDIPESHSSIGQFVFYNYTKLEKITIPSSVTSIGIEAFAGCTGLTSIKIPNSVTVIDPGAFSGCTGLTSIEISNSITSIGSSFSGCTGLNSIVIPNSVNTIGRYAFSGCTGLTSIVIPNSVTTIEEKAFFGCTGLESIVIPSSVVNFAHAYSTGIINGVHTYTYYGTFTGYSGTVVFASGTTRIPSFALYYSDVSSVLIPNTVTSIENNAFYSSTNLTSVSYSGNKNNWNNIMKGADWKRFVNATLTCTDGTYPL